MILTLCRAIAHLLAIVIVPVLALAGLAVAIFSLGSGTATASYHQLAALLQLPALRDAVGAWFDQLEAPGPIAIMSLLGGLVAVAVGLLLVAGTLAPRRDRLVGLESDQTGRLLARPRALAGAAGAIVNENPDNAGVRVQARPRRRGNGAVLRVRTGSVTGVPARTVTERTNAELEQLTDEFGLKIRVMTKAPRVGERAK